MNKKKEHPSNFIKFSRIGMAIGKVPSAFTKATIPTKHKKAFEELYKYLDDWIKEVKKYNTGLMSSIQNFNRGAYSGLVNGVLRNVIREKDILKAPEKVVAIAKVIKKI